MKKCLCCNKSFSLNDIINKIKIIPTFNSEKVKNIIDNENIDYNIDDNVIVVNCPNKECTLYLLNDISNKATIDELKELVKETWNKRSGKENTKNTCPSCGQEQVYEEHESVHQSAVRKEGVYTVNCHSANTGNGCGLSVDVYIDTGLKNNEVREKAKEIAKETFQFLNKNK